MLIDLRKRVDELNRQISVLMAEREQFESKIAAAETLLGKVPAREAPGAIPSLKEVVRELMRDGVRRSPREMRETLVARGIEAERVSSSTGNFYNSVHRLLQEGALIKDPDGRYRYFK
jgi:hypothetical protein